MDVERALVSKIIQTGQLEDALSKGIRSDLFADEECQDVFEFVVAHARRYKTPPTTAAVKDNKPKWEMEHTQESLDYLIDRFIVLAKRRLANDMVIELAAACNDPARAERIEQEFLEVSRKLTMLVPTTQTMLFKEGMEKRIEEYERRAKEGEKYGIQFGYPSLDEWTGGIQPHEFVTVAGFSGLGKSTFLKSVTFNVWVQGKTPLYISLEEEAKAILRKFDAMAGALDYQKMKQLQLPAEQIANWREIAKKIQESAGEIPIIDSIRHCTPDTIYSEIVRHKPDLVIVDYLSLMRSSSPTRGNSMWQSLTEITQDMKQIARALHTPIMAAAQTNRGGGKDGAELDNIGYSLSVVQDSDIVIGLFADDEMKERNEMQIRLNKNRDGRLGRFMANWDHDKMLYRQKTMTDMFGRGGSK